MMFTSYTIIFFVDDNVSNKQRQLAKGYEFSALLFTYTVFIFSLLEYTVFYKHYIWRIVI